VVTSAGPRFSLLETETGETFFLPGRTPAHLHPGDRVTFDVVDEQPAPGRRRQAYDVAPE
jgi:hypothetical protein